MLHTYRERQFFAEPNADGSTELWAYGEHTTYPLPYCEVVCEYGDDADAFSQLVEDCLIDAGLICVIDDGAGYEACAVIEEMQREAAEEAAHVASYRSTYFTRFNLL